MVLKEVYKDIFYIGTAVESIHDQFTNNEIGNPDKEALIVREFSSMTCANEMKPAYNMGWNSPDAREDYLPYVINPNAKKMLDWVRANGLKMRAHVMVWHSQCAQEAFCKEYKPVFEPVDEEKLKENPRLRFFQKLDPVCFVDRDTMLKRLESYIDSMLEYIYREGYAEQIYAWDVVNEAIELADKTETGLRNSYWYQVIGDDFIYWAFRFAKAAVLKLSVQYAGVYGIDPTDEAALARIRPTLVYNDYNEWQPDKKAAIIAALKREGHGHGSIIGEGLIDGIGMQGHISDNNTPPWKSRSSTLSPDCANGSARARSRTWPRTRSVSWNVRVKTQWQSPSATWKLTTGVFTARSSRPWARRVNSCGTLSSPRHW